jgi:hypothetical protein
MSEQKTRQKKPKKPAKPTEFKTEHTADLKFTFLDMEVHLVKHVESHDLFHLSMSEEDFMFEVEGGYTIHLVKRRHLECPQSIWFCGYIGLPENHILNEKDIYQGTDLIFRACGCNFPPEGFSPEIMTVRLGFDTAWEKYNYMSVFEALKLSLQYVVACKQVQSIGKDEVFRLIYEKFHEENHEDDEDPQANC